MDLETKLTSLDSDATLQKPCLFWMWAVPLFAFIALMILPATGSNIALFEFLNHHMSQAGDMWWSNLTVLGDTSLALSVNG